MKINILTLFPDMFDCLNYGVLGKAIENKKIILNILNIRDFSNDKHKKCDDTPYGGGAGMVMTCQPIHEAFINCDKDRKSRRIYMSPKGTQLKQSHTKQYAKLDEITILCCNYEGVDQRIIDLHIDDEISIGDYVLTNGELPAMVFINVISRHLQGVLGNSISAKDESFSNNLLEYPHYTKPKVFESLEVPEVLLSGNHQLIENWRSEKSIEITKNRRPDLL